MTEKHEELKKAAEPLNKLLVEKYNPHVTANVTSTSVELVEGILNIPKIDDFIGREGLTNNA